MTSYYTKISDVQMSGNISRHHEMSCISCADWHKDWNYPTNCGNLSSIIRCLNTFEMGRLAGTLASYIFVEFEGMSFGHFSDHFIITFHVLVLIHITWGVVFSLINLSNVTSLALTPVCWTAGLKRLLLSHTLSLIPDGQNEQNYVVIAVLLR